MAGPSSSVYIQHKVTLVGQPTDMSCWSAAVTMITGNTFSAGPGSASVAESGGLSPDDNNIYTFAQSQGLRVFALQTWSVEGLINLLRNGPVAMLGVMPRRHSVVIAGIASEGTPDTTVLTIYDPYPVLKGQIMKVNYQQLMTTFPLSTMYMLQR